MAQLSLCQTGSLEDRAIDGEYFIALIPSLRSYFLRRTGNLNIIEDLVQEVVLRILARRCSEDIQNPQAYAFRAAANVLRDRARRESVRKTEHYHLIHDMDLRVEHRTPERVFLAKEKVLKVAEALQELPDKTRVIFMLKRFEGLSHAEIASRVGLSPSGIEKQVAKAVAHLARRIAE